MSGSYLVRFWFFFGSCPVHAWLLFVFCLILFYCIGVVLVLVGSCLVRVWLLCVFLCCYWGVIVWFAFGSCLVLVWFLCCSCLVLGSALVGPCLVLVWFL